MAQKFIIVGGTGGIGSAIARRISTRGDLVHLIGRHEEKLSALSKEIGGSHAVADVMDSGKLEEAIAAAGPDVSGLCYAVGSVNLKPFMKLTEVDAVRELNLNAIGAFRAIQAVMPILEASPGTSSILLFSSVAVAQGFSSHATTAMAKGAVEGLAISLAAEFSPRIRVNCIAPSLIRTPLTSSFTQSEQMAKAIAGLHPMHRLGEADDVANVAAFLLSEEAGWVTGQVIGVDGGRSTLRPKG